MVSKGRAVESRTLSSVHGGEPARADPPFSRIRYHISKTLTQREQMIYNCGKRHTGGWCGPGQRLTPSARCQPLPRWTGQRPALQADPAPDTCPGRPGSRRQTSLIPTSELLVRRVSRSIPPAQPTAFVRKKRMRPRFPASRCLSPSRAPSPSTFLLQRDFTQTCLVFPTESCQLWAKLVTTTSASERLGFL